MKPFEKIKFIDDLSRELQKRMTFKEIDNYFKDYSIPISDTSHYNSKFVYCRDMLSNGISDDVLFQIADELDIQHDYHLRIKKISSNDLSFWKNGYFKLFISHLASFKETIGKLKLELEKYGISSFVAHEDIEPTKEWQTEIESGLFTMDALCAVLMPGFKESDWTDQEIGVALGRDVLIIPIRKGLDPYGFIGKYQGFQAYNKTIGEVSNAIFEILHKNDKTRLKIIDVLINLILISNSLQDANQKLQSLNSINNIPLEKINSMRSNILENKMFNDFNFLDDLNKLFFLYNVKKIESSDFENKIDIDFDDWPF